MADEEATPHIPLLKTYEDPVTGELGRMYRAYIQPKYDVAITRHWLREKHRSKNETVNTLIGEALEARAKKEQQETAYNESRKFKVKKPKFKNV